MTTTALTNQTTRAHLAAFDALAGALPGAGDAALSRLRQEALARFAAAGLPTRRLEDWKFTGLDALTRAAFAPATEAAPGIERAALAGIAPEGDVTTLIFVQGHFDAALSDALPQGVTSFADTGSRLAPALSDGAGSALALVALNAAFMSGGAVVDLADDAELEKPLVLLFLAGGDGAAAAHSRNVIRLGARARARVVEIHASLPGSAGAFSNTVTDVALGAGAHLTHARIAGEGAGALHHSHTAVAVGAGAAYESFALSVGGDLTRQESDVRFTATGGRTRLLGAYLGRGHQHMDHTTRVHHDHPGCTTEELFKGALDDHAHGVFQGLIRVAPHAVRTDANQKNTNLLLSDRAVADTKPELEILADDVKCSHGATVGDLDADEIFYLRARGLTADDSRRLLLAGYLEDLITRLDDEALGAILRVHTTTWLGAWLGENAP